MSRHTRILVGLCDFKLFIAQVLDVGCLIESSNTRLIPEVRLAINYRVVQTKRHLVLLNFLILFIDLVEQQFEINPQLHNTKIF